MSTIFSSLFRRSKPSTSSPPFDIRKNPWKAKRRWPPDFSQLSQKEQFKFERRFRRRHKLKWARPTFTKAIKITQWGSIIAVVIYGVFVYEDKPGSKDMPFSFARDWYQRWANSLFPSLTRPNEQLPNSNASRQNQNQQES